MVFFIIFICLFAPGPQVFSQNGAHGVPGSEAAGIAASLDDNALAAQVLLTGIDGKSSLSPEMKSLLEKIPAGGIMLFRYNLDTPKDGAKKFLGEAFEAVAGNHNKAGPGFTDAKMRIAPFMAVDHEGGIVHRFGPGVEKLPSAFSFWDLAQKEGRAAALGLAEDLYRNSAKEIRALGINMVLGPVAEILNEDNRLFLDTRSYGSDPDFVQAVASVFIKCMDDAGIACVLKHFPGNTAADPHSGIPLLSADKAALDGMVKPFAGLIRSLQLPALMLSHAMVPAVDNKRSASLSAPVIEGWLRGELGFSGIVMADDFTMGAIAAQGLQPARASVDALIAGVDMVMTWPQNITGVHSAILEALRGGRLPRERLLNAASRIIALKLRYGLLELQQER